MQHASKAQGKPLYARACKSEHLWGNATDNSSRHPLNNIYICIYIHIMQIYIHIYIYIYTYIYIYIYIHWKSGEPLEHAAEHIHIYRNMIYAEHLWAGGDLVEMARLQDRARRWIGISTYIYIYLSLSLYIYIYNVYMYTYIYIYIGIYTESPWEHEMPLEVHNDF